MIKRLWHRMPDLTIFGILFHFCESVGSNIHWGQEEFHNGKAWIPGIKITVFGCCFTMSFANDW